jgi:hypothetical protein
MEPAVTPSSGKDSNSEKSGTARSCPLNDSPILDVDYAGGSRDRWMSSQGRDQ